MTMQQGKLLYVSRLNESIDNHVGTLKKVRGMCKGFSAVFEKVFFEYEKGPVFFIDSVDGNRPVLKKTYKGIVGRSRFYSNLIDWIKNNGITVFYIRFDHLDFVMLSLFKKLKKIGVRVILELPTYPYAGERDKRHKSLLKRRKYFQYLIKRIAVLDEERNIKNAYKYVDRIVTFTHTGRIWNIPSLCIENGVDCSAVRVRNHNNTSNTIIIGCVANLAIWHAIDRLIEGLKNYYENNPCPEYIIDFWMIGVGQESPHIQNLVQEYGLESHVVFHGAKRGKELEALMEQFDIGVGTLGLHRIGLEWGSTLKSKEYCASGLPFIYASREKALKGDEPFALKFEDDESPIDMEKVLPFALRVRNDPALRQEMRRKAEAEYSWEALVEKIMRDDSYE